MVGLSDFFHAKGRHAQFLQLSGKIPPKSGSFHFYHGFTSVVTNISPHSGLYLNSYGIFI